VTEITAAIVSGAFVYFAMEAKKNSELKQEIFLRLNRLETSIARLEERCPMKPSR
jgi:hypothetical protein|tara:strand:- start:1413 stop:1577 length:165 start_codon:yes stop_codon:yes gene_type:complete